MSDAFHVFVLSCAAMLMHMVGLLRRRDSMQAKGEGPPWPSRGLDPFTPNLDPFWGSQKLLRPPGAPGTFN